jgi:hypothetical protein
MNINKNCKLFLQNVYSYDISACHYNILEKLGVDISHLDKNDKTQRNIQIGLMMRNNPKLTPVLRGTTESIISEYILRNNISEDDIVIRQYDGILTTKKLKETTDMYLPLDLRKIFQVFLISIDRTKYIGLDEKFSTTIKGVPHRYERIEKIYEEILKINFMNKTSIFKKLDEIKHRVLFGKNPELYGIPSSNNLFSIFFKQYGQIDITESMLRIMDTEDIDKEKYYDLYIRPFFESIVVEFV